MKKNTIWAIVITITVIFATLAWINRSHADTVEITPEPKPLHQKVQNWAQDEWNDIKVYQAESWESGKQQLARNKEQVSTLFQNIANAISNIIE